jgi:hypothetical protein
MSFSMTFPNSTAQQSVGALHANTWQLQAIQPCGLYSMPLTKLHSTEKYIMHYSPSKDSDDGTVATETVNTVHCLMLKCKTTQRFSGRICLRPQGEWGKGRTYCDGTVRNSWSHPWSRPTKVGSPVYPFHLKMGANKI